MSWSFWTYRAGETGVPRWVLGQGQEDHRVCLCQLWEAEGGHGESSDTLGEGCLAYISAIRT